MSDIIHLLPDSIANQIAAGEVIQRPASVIKELMENAIDAGATQVIVNIKEAGKNLIQVIDNGIGMSETDARMAFERHATSKIKKADDLFSLCTMGFRGEALASIAAVAHVDLRTRLKGAELGTHLTIAGSVVEESEPTACAEGSVFSIKNLFYNVPARRKFLKSNETEFRNIVTEFERVVLVNPTISFLLYHNEMEVYNLPSAGLRQRIIHVFGKNLNQKLLPVHVKASLVSIEGYVGSTDSVKKRGALQYFFVNGRYMRHPYFHKAVIQAYEQLITPGEMPDYFIYLTLAPASIDVNIHPTKTEIKFENEQPIWQILCSVVKEALAKSNSVPTIDFDTEGSIDIPVYHPANVEYTPAPQVEVNKDYNPFRNTGSNVGPKPSQDWEVLYKGFENDHVPSYSSSVSSPLDFPDEMPAAPEDGIAAMYDGINSPCYQYKLRYIVTPIKSGLVLIDQHRAHVKILYDQYVANLKQRKSASQQLLFPEIVEFTVAESVILPKLSDDLSLLGFDLSNLGNNAYAINALPAGLEQQNPVELVKHIVNTAAELGNQTGEEMQHTLALTLARSAAIRTGKQLSTEEMEHLVASLFSLPSNNITPDGKPIMSILTDDELERRFK